MLKGIHFSPQKDRFSDKIHGALLFRKNESKSATIFYVIGIQYVAFMWIAAHFWEVLKRYRKPGDHPQNVRQKPFRLV